MMYMPDAARATLELMHANKDRLSVDTSYNVGSFSLNPDTLHQAIKKHIPNFTISYNLDFRDQLAKSWPSSIDDSQALKDWGWKAEYDIEKMTGHMLNNIKVKLDV